MKALSLSGLRQRGTAKLSQAKEALESRQKFVKFLETRETAQGHTEDRSIWKNEDLDLTPPEGWTWAWYDYAAFWWSYGFSVGVWSVGSSMIALGLVWWQAIICVFISHFLGALGIALHSRLAARWHMGYPVEARISWGMIGSYFPVFVRLMIGTIWNAVNTLEAGYFMSILIRCIFGNGWVNLHNPFPASASITVQELAGFLLFVFLTAPLLAIPVPKIRRLYTIKSFLLPPMTIGLFAFAIVQSKNSPGSAGAFSGSGALHGSKLAWAMLSAINSCMGKTSTQVCNQTDLARYSRTADGPFWSQLIALPIGNTLCATLGIFATSSIHRAWGVLIWNPWDLATEILDRNWTSGARAAIAIVCLGFMFSGFASNLGVNVIPWGADVTVFLPRFLNIRRGMYLCYFLGFILFPWKILESSTTFLRFLGGYGIFLAPLSGMFITDYYMVRKGNIWAEDLFKGNSQSAYWYHYGVSWRVVVTFTITVVVLTPGFAAQFGHKVGTGWIHLYEIGWVFGCTFSSVLYYALALLGDYGKRERQMGWEEAYFTQNMFQGITSGGEAGPVVEGVVMPGDAKTVSEKVIGQ